MCDKAVEKNPQRLQDVLDHLKAWEMSEKAVEKASWVLEIVPDQYKMQGALRQLRKVHAP